jgi:L-lactate utilization protein LutB
MTPLEQRNERLAQTIIKNLKRRHIEGFYCATAEEAVKKVSELIEDGSSVTWGGTMTVRDLGIPQYLKDRGTLEVLDRDLVETPEEKQEMYLRAFSTDVYLSSANAISEDGVIVNIDGNGNRVAAITWGPKKVIFVIGLNKVAQTVEAALARARSTASPINAQRFDINTPCRIDGTCHNCNSPESICSYVHFLRNSRNKGRHVVVLVGEDLGY